MVDIVRLKAVIDAEADNATRTDEEVLIWFDAQITVERDVPWNEYMLWLSEVSGLRRMQAASDDAVQPDDVRNAADLGIVIAQAAQALQLSDSRVRAAMAPLIGPVFTTAEVDTLVAKSDASLERWLAERFPQMDDFSKLYWIGQARAL